MAKKKQILFPVVFMILITAFFTFLLAFINDFTKETIEDQQALIIQKSLFYSFNIPTKGLDDKTIQTQFETYMTIDIIDDRTYYTYTKDGSIEGYALQLSGKGLWGTIVGHVAFTPDHTKLLGVNFVSHSETPGLGGRIDEDWYKEQFRDVSLENTNELFSYNVTAGNVNAITGATLTSIAVKDIFNLEIPQILEDAKKEGFYESN